MKDLQTLEKLQKIFNEVTGKSDIMLTINTKIDDSIGASSFIKIQLICAIEDEFNIEISNKQIKKIKTVKNMIKILEENK